jgi:hypothetical protein
MLLSTCLKNFKQIHSLDQTDILLLVPPVNTVFIQPVRNVVVRFSSIAILLQWLLEHKRNKKRKINCNSFPVFCLWSSVWTSLVAMQTYNQYLNSFFNRVIYFSNYTQMCPWTSLSYSLVWYVKYYSKENDSTIFHLDGAPHHYSVTIYVNINKHCQDRGLDEGDLNLGHLHLRTSCR